MALTKVSGEVITRPLVLTGNASVSGIITVGTGSSATTIDGSFEYPSIRPTLDLNFAATKTLDRRITFTRNSLGTYTDELGIIRTAPNNTPRFDHDPVTGESLGLLIEESRTNLFPVSGDATDVNWTKLAVTAETDTSVIAPDGTAGATKVIQDNTTAQHLIGDTAASLTLGGYYALSVFVKNGTHTGKVYFSVASFSNWVGDWQFYIDFDTGEVANTTNVEAAKLKVEQYPNGWWRLSMVAQQEPAGTGSGGFWVGFGNNNGNESSNFAGDGSSYFYVWGGQMEAGAFATSYIPTSGSTVTRAVEIAQITGTNFTGFYNGTEGTVFSEIRPMNLGEPLGNANVYWSFNQVGGFGEGIYFSNSSGAQSVSSYLVIDNSVLQVTGVEAPNLSDGVDFKSAFVYKENDYISATNGTLGSADTSATVPSNGRLVIGNNAWGSTGPSGANPGTAHYKSFKYYNKRLPNAQLKGLTAQ